MADSHETNRFATQLLQQDNSLGESTYQEYRMNLENALTTAERREKLCGRIACISFVVGAILMFVGGSRIVGSFDPWEKEATILSVSLGVIYCLALVTWPVAVASYYSRFRPKIRNI